ncbi:hypothetical protein TNCV_2522321 [Trichonephila clavipes]|nr:hypothetical protein TNCV_2522321 [Trichonephila clavipes]
MNQIELGSELSDISDDDKVVNKTYESCILEGESSLDESDEETHGNQNAPIEVVTSKTACPLLRLVEKENSWEAFDLSSKRVFSLKIDAKTTRLYSHLYGTESYDERKAYVHIYYK